MTELPYTPEQLHALHVALARGERRVSFGDRLVEYRSVEELRAAIREVEAALSRAAGGTRTRQVRVNSNKGF